MTSTRAACNSTPAINVHNENPSLIALGKAHPHEPESDAITGVTQSQPGTHGRTADERTVGRWPVGRTDDGWTDGARTDGRPT